jgi:hypothetical protein
MLGTRRKTEENNSLKIIFSLNQTLEIWFVSIWFARLANNDGKAYQKWMNFIQFFMFSAIIGYCLSFLVAYCSIFFWDNILISFLTTISSFVMKKSSNSNEIKQKNQPKSVKKKKMNIFPVRWISYIHTLERDWLLFGLFSLHFSYWTRIHIKA